MWTREATLNHGSPLPRLKGPHQSVGVRYPKSRGHTEAWESATPNQGATPKCGSPLPQLKGPHRSVGVHYPNSRGHTEALESITPTQGATPKRWSPLPQLKGPLQALPLLKFGNPPPPQRKTLVKYVYAMHAVYARSLIMPTFWWLLIAAAVSVLRT